LVNFPGLELLFTFFATKCSLSSSSARSKISLYHISSVSDEWFREHIGHRYTRGQKLFGFFIFIYRCQCFFKIVIFKNVDYRKKFYQNTWRPKHIPAAQCSRIYLNRVIVYISIKNYLCEYIYICI